jgi:hypothetical protein
LAKADQAVKGVGDRPGGLGQLLADLVRREALVRVVAKVPGDPARTRGKPRIMTAASEEIMRTVTLSKQFSQRITAAASA